jgi:hypothetical protein
MLATAKSTRKSTKPNTQSVRSKKKPSCLASLLHQSKTRVLLSVMTTHKRHGLLALTTKQSLWASLLTEEAIEDNLYDSLSARYTKGLARAMAYTKQVKAAATLNNGFTGGQYAGGDGVALFSTAHPLISGGTNSNTFTTQADLNETSLENAVIQIAGWTDERGLLIAARPKKLIVPSALQFVATRLLETSLRVGTTDNDVNAIKNNGSIPEGWVINHFLTDTNAWFLTTDVPNGMKHFIRTEMTTGMDGDFDTGNVRYKARERYSFGFSDPLGMFGSQGAAI